MLPAIIIDAYNIIHRTSDLRSYLKNNLEASREQLLHKLILFKKNKKLNITVVFDGNWAGQPSHTKRSGINILYSVPPKKADEVIKNLLQSRKNCRSITVVSSDNEIIGFAKSCKANTMRSEEFYTKYLIFADKFNSTENEQNMSKAELEYWLELFEQSDKS
jgi:predicted RNA-binding protein with PIN domain